VGKDGLGDERYFGGIGMKSIWRYYVPRGIYLIRHDRKWFISRMLDLTVLRTMFVKRALLKRLFWQGLPSELREGLVFLLTGDTNEGTLRLSDKIETIRANIAAKGDEKVAFWYSPKPGSADDRVTHNTRPKPGEILDFTMQHVARTGKKKHWGVFLHLLGEAHGARTIFELGSCAGISGCYIASADSVKEFITVEGSSALAKMADQNIRRVFPTAKVINSLFDDAIDQEVPKLKQSIDYVFIDGHHERIATIHYYERLLPYLSQKAIVVFDDISWSYDMREAWKELSARREFCHAVDLGEMGVCIYDPSSTGEDVRYWDLQPILGRYPIGDHPGWERYYENRIRYSSISEAE